MGLTAPSAEALGLVVDRQVEQRNPAFGHEGIVAIAPHARSVVARGSVVTVTVNLAGEAERQGGAATGPRAQRERHRDRGPRRVRS